VEEVVLLDEEMRRVLMFCEWKNGWWKDQVSKRDNLSSELAEGLHAYAREQAAMELSLADSFTAKWAAVRLRAQPLVSRFWGSESDDIEMMVEDSEEEVVVEFMVGEEDDNDGGGSDFEE
jgi:hypothetical protein